ncbi:MAG: 5-(carboxyamino)imidazole ribonucleotide synthase [Alphaproteobacteria bacterium]|nr:5-(carboxyamino)imidazole ribonucleotide synthase [Alphaproteobacteria bacterium]
MITKDRTRDTKEADFGSKIGILGGGQLGRMLVLAAAEMGLKCHIYTPYSDSPALDVSPYRTIAPYDDEAELTRFARQCCVITYESENIPLDSLRILSRYTSICPGIDTLKITQDRLQEKEFIRDLGLPVLPFYPVDNEKDISHALTQTGLPAIIKTRRSGYDGKGQSIITNHDQISTAWNRIKQQPAILECFIPFSKEISLLSARGKDGSIRTYDLPENEHQEQILRRSRVPARISSNLNEKAEHIGRIIATALNYVGVIAIEMFVQESPEGEKLIVNEIAPRVHNSGHWTMEACSTSQFKQHIRAIMGWPLSDPKRHSDVVMENLIGTEVENWQNILTSPHSAVHIYGKTEVRPLRKMGHVNYLKPFSSG